MASALEERMNALEAEVERLQNRCSPTEPPSDR